VSCVDFISLSKPFFAELEFLFFFHKFQNRVNFLVFGDVSIPFVEIDPVAQFNHHHAVIFLTLSFLVFRLSKEKSEIGFLESKLPNVLLRPFLTVFIKVFFVFNSPL
jgi:hypothetical protein